MIAKTLYLLLTALICFALYVRFGPVQADKWAAPDIALTQVGDTLGDRSFTAVRVVEDEAALKALGQVALSTPRTRLLTAEPRGWITYVTRSRWFGFPDYTSVRLARLGGQPVLQIHARARFGKLDMGVNKARVENWLAQLDLLTPQG